MASSTQTKPNRLLRELLKEEQEPFTLQAYLSERGYAKSEASEVSNKSGTCNIHRSQNRLKSACRKLLLIVKSLRVKNCDDRGGEKEASRPVMAVYIPLPSDDSKSFDSRDRINDKFMAKNQEESRSIPRTLRSKKVTEDSNLRDLVLANKKLMFDCVREIIESNGRKEARFGEILGPEEIGKLICHRAREWGKRSGNETNMNKLLNLDFQESTEQWYGIKKQKREVAMAIGDDILEELEKELVMDMMVDSSPISLSLLHSIYNT